MHKVKNRNGELRLRVEMAEHDHERKKPAQRHGIGFPESIQHGVSRPADSEGRRNGQQDHCK